MSGRRRVGWRVAAAVALAAMLVGSCSSGGSSATEVDRRTVAVVSDSEITPEIVELMAAEPQVEVVHRHNQPGATIAELDGQLDEALAAGPEALVYTAGANDLAATGIEAMLDSLRERLDRAGAVTCVVYAVPAVDTSAMTEAEAETTRSILEGFAAVLDDWRVLNVPYLTIADQMAAQGEEFFAGGELGSFHPGDAAYAPIAEALTEKLEQCP